MKYLEIRLLCNHVREVVVIRKDEIISLRSKPNESFEGETFIKTLILLKHGELIISTTQEYADALHSFIKDDSIDKLMIEGDCSTSY